MLLINITDTRICESDSVVKCQTSPNTNFAAGKTAGRIAAGFVCRNNTNVTAYSMGSEDECVCTLLD